mgnify:CR=1 FL=1|jgi:hypothetical protein
MGILGRLYLMYLEKSRWRRKRIVDPASFLVVIRRANGVSHSGEPQTTEVWLAGGEEERSYIESQGGQCFYDSLIPFGMSGLIAQLSDLDFMRVRTELTAEAISVPLDFGELYPSKRARMKAERRDYKYLAARKAAGKGERAVEDFGDGIPF